MTVEEREAKLREAGKHLAEQSEKWTEHHASGKRPNPFEEPLKLAEKQYKKALNKLVKAQHKLTFYVPAA